MADPKQQPSYVGQPTSIPGKPILEALPTPNLDDRILVVRKDLRLFKKLPRKGSKYTGPNAENFRDFKFATAKVSDQIGWVNWYYINERKNQDDYNFEVTYPYASKDYPTFTRTYVYLRGDQRGKEPDADSKDPVYGDLSLTDHKVIRLQQPELDALFVGIQRVYERLPGPVIVSHRINEPQQDVTLSEFEDISPSFPTVDALTEVATLERKTTAKAKVTLGTVTEVFPATDYKFGGEDPINPYRFRRFGVRVPALVTAQTQAGTAVAVTSFGTDEWGHDEQQVTKYKKRVTSNIRSSTGLPVTIIQQKLTPEQQVATDTETYDNSVQTLTPTALMIEGEIDNLGNGQSIKHETTIPLVFPKAIYEASIPDPVPEKFRVTIPVASSELTSIGTAGPPVLGTGELERKDEQTTTFWHRLYIKGRDITQLPVSLVSYDLTPEQQVATVTETLAVGLQTLSPDALLLKASVNNLGNNTSLKSTSTVVDVFSKAEYSTSIPDIIPERFRVAVPVTESILSSAGTASPPVLGTGDLERRDMQEKEFIHRLAIKGRAGVALPISLVSYKMTREKQVETVIETLNTGLQTISPNDLTIEADVSNLGNNTSLKTVGTVPSLFTEAQYEISIPNAIPQEFRVLVPTTVTEILSPGTAAPPRLGVGNLSVSQKQVNEFVLRTRTESFAGVALPVTLTNQELTREFGGAETNVISTLDVITSPNMVLDEGYLVLKSEVKNLGNGMGLKTTQQNNGVAWPGLGSWLWDDTMRVEYFVYDQVVPFGTLPDDNPGFFGFQSEIKPIDVWRSRKTNVAKPQPIYNSQQTALITYEYRPYKFPGYIYAAVGGYYIRKASAQLCKHTIRTWWVSSPTTPVIAVDEIIVDQVIINSLNDATQLQYADDVLHDTLFTFGSFFYPATTPSGSQYAFGTQTGTSIQNFAALDSFGSGGSNVGETIVITGGGHSCTVQVTSVTDFSGLHGVISGYTNLGGNFSAGSYGPFSAAHGTTWSVVAAQAPTYDSSTRWIGNEKIIAASVVPEKEKDVWKCQTTSIIMR